MKKLICKECGKEYKEDTAWRRISNKNGFTFCSPDCYAKSEEGMK